MEIHNSRSVDQTASQNAVPNATLEGLPYDPRGHLTEPAVISKKRGGAKEGVCLASNVFWWPIRIHCTQRVKKKRTWKIVRKETPFPKNPFRVYVQFPELVPFEFSKRHSPSTIIILNATSHTLFAARKTQDTFQRVIFVCVCVVSPQKGFPSQRTSGRKIPLPFRRFLSRRRALESRARRRRERRRRRRSLYLGVAMDAEGAAGAGGKPVELFFHEFQQDVFDEVFFWL